MDMKPSKAENISPSKTLFSSAQNVSCESVSEIKLVPSYFRITC
jgi:hypothetical protein